MQSDQMESTLSVSVPDEVEAAALIMYRRDSSIGPTAPTWYDLTDDQRDIWLKRALHAFSGLAAAGYKVVRAGVDSEPEKTTLTEATIELRLVRLYRSEKGIWCCDIKRDGIIKWSSLHTRNEAEARAKYECLQRVFMVLGEARTPSGFSQLDLEMMRDTRRYCWLKEQFVAFEAGRYNSPTGLIVDSGRFDEIVDAEIDRAGR